MTDQRSLVKRLLEGNIELTASLIGQALRSDTLRGLVMSEMEKRLVAQIKSSATMRPAQCSRINWTWRWRC